MGTSNGAASYEYCYATSAADCTTWVSRGTLKYVTLSGLSANTTYYWHVRAVSNFGTTYAGGSPTAHWTFTTAGAPGAFERNWPMNGVSNQGPNPTVYWNKSNGAVSFEYCYATSAAECTNWVNVGTAKYAALSGLSANTTYYWHVRAVSDFGLLTYAGGSETAYWTLTTGGAAAGPFNKSWPSSGATGQPSNATLYWGTSSGASSYEYCYATSAAECTNWVSVGTAKSVALSGLSANTTYYWQVRAVNNFGLFTYANGSDTAHWTFRTAP